MRSTASTIGSIENIPSVTGEIFHLDDPQLMRHVRDE